jgi:GH15 family glucan-1,4-alpha-glucosidase
VIADYALLADCHGSALVGRDGSIDWCCLPRFDSGALFTRLLDPGTGAWSLDVDGRVGERRYLDNTMVLETVLHSDDGEARLLDFMPLDRRAVVRVVEGVRGSVTVRSRATPRFDYGEVTPWFRVRGEGVITATGGDDGLLCLGFALDGTTLVREATVRAGERVQLVLAAFAPEELDDVPAVDIDLDATVRQWRAWSEVTEHPELDVGVSARVLKALIYAPTGAMVAAPTLGLPEAPAGDERRTWDYRYAWIRDAVLATRCLTELGHDGEAKAFRRFVDRSGAGVASEVRVFYGVRGERRLSERVLDHLQGFDGAQPLRVGNGAGPQLQLDTYGHLMEQSWTWATFGDPPDDDEWRFLCGLADAAAERWDDPDCGIWEWRGGGRHFVHSKVMCWVALDRGLRLASRTGRSAPVDRWAAARDEIREAVLSRGRRDGVFLQAFGCDDLDAAVLRFPSYGFVPYEEMAPTVAAVRAALDDGTGLLRRYTADDGMPPEGAFLACSFWLVECLAGMGERDEARRVYGRVLCTANDLGLFSEQIDVETGALLGNFPLVLTHLSHIHASLALQAAR